MIANIFKVAIRNLLKKTGYTFINVAGLTTGLACSILIFLYVINEMTYDRYHQQADRTYRIGVRGQMPGSALNQAVTSAPMMEALLNDYPEVEKATRFGKFGGWLVSSGERKFQETEESFIFADSSFFDVFGFTLLQGDPEGVLREPYSLVMTREYAGKYFGDVDPVGKTLKIEQDTNLYTVTGIMKKVPENTHFHFEMVGSLNTLGVSRSTIWLNHNLYTYVVLSEGTDTEKFTEGLREMIFKYVGPQVEQYMGITIEQFEESGNTFGYFLQPLTSIHLHSNLQHEAEANGNPVYVYVFFVIAVLILVIACINFMNLATARSVTRAREVGIRKVVGSGRSLLILQFLAESVLLSLVSLLMAVLLVYLLLPAYNNMIRMELSFDVFANTYTLPLLIGLAIIVGLLAGSYPAFVLSAFHPTAVLKGDMKAGSGNRLLRSILVVLQFSVSIAILLGTLVVNRQLTYMQQKDLGFNKNNVLVIRRSDALNENIDAFKQELVRHSNILSVSNSTHIPSMPFWNNVHWLEGEDMTNTILLWATYTGYGFDETLGLNMLEGRYFQRDTPTDSFAVVINEATVRSLNLEDPLHTRFFQPGATPEETVFYPVIGVVRDFHFMSMHDDIQPAIIHFMPGNWEGYIVVRMGEGNVPETVDFVERTWNDFGTDYPFEYTWLDDEFDKLFEPERRTEQILFAFSILSIFISCLGLFGLISYSISQRTKEIGIRKSMGASVNSIMVMLLRETLSLLAIASLLSLPAYFIVRQWLRNFAFRIDFNPGVFLLYLAGVGLVVLIIAMFAVSYQSYRAAISNPADSLRVE